MPETAAVRLVWQGEDCLSLHWPARIDAALNARVHRVAERIRGAPPGALCDLVPAYASLALYFDSSASLDRPVIEAQVAALLAQADAAPTPEQSDTLAIPVCYHPELAPDLLDAAQRLGIDAQELATRHAAGTYQVAMIGFAPGFPYLLGLDPTLALPRHAQPRARVAAGSVGIAGQQTGIYPQESPGGWQLIGRTPWPLFDPAANPPTRLTPGQRLRFTAIDLDQFHRLSDAPA